MAHGKAVEDVKWYVRRRNDRGAECGPYSTEQAAIKAMERRSKKVHYELYVARANIARSALQALLIGE